MSFLLDTNVLSEAIRREPSPAVLKWFEAQSDISLYISAITLGELLRGALLLEDGKRRRALLEWIEGQVKPEFRDRILPVDSVVMERWAHLQVSSAREGFTLPMVDSLIAATALSNGLTLVTRNTRDFRSTKVPLINPWEM